MPLNSRVSLCIRVAVLCSLFFSLAPERGRAAQLIADYSGDGVNEGFNDPTLGASRKAAFEYALGLWSAVLGDAYVGEQVVVDAVFNPLGGTGTLATLGSAGPKSFGNVPGNSLGANVPVPPSGLNTASTTTCSPT